MNSYRKKFDRLRMARGLTLAELASRSSLSVPAVSRIINGRSKPSQRSRHLLADALDCSVRDIFADEEGMEGR